jgi:hypothetical protein
VLVHRGVGVGTRSGGSCGWQLVHRAVGGELLEASAGSNSNQSGAVTHGVDTWAGERPGCGNGGVDRG